MPQEFVFIGKPGPNAATFLQILKDAEITPKRMNVSIDIAGKLSADPPVAIMICDEVDNLREVITSLREDQSLISVPLVAAIEQLDPEFLTTLFRYGIDDYFLKGSFEQFTALVSMLKKEDTWLSVKAMAGKVILAHPDRFERLRLGKVLRRNGFDAHFASSTTEIEQAAMNPEIRAVIVSIDLPGGNIFDVMRRVAGKVKSPAPWVIVAQPKQAEKLAPLVPPKLKVSFFEAGTDAEGLTFVMSELLTPPPAGSRKSVRLLYGTPISFKPLGEKTTFYGFTFNISLGGIYVRSLTGLPLQTRIEISFKPPFGRGYIVADAQVAWLKKLGDADGNAPPGMGAQFTDIWQSDRAALEAGYELLKKETLDQNI